MRFLHISVILVIFVVFPKPGMNSNELGGINGKEFVDNLDVDIPRKKRGFQNNRTNERSLLFEIGRRDEKNVNGSGPLASYCLECDKECGSVTAYDEHGASAHPKKKIFECPVAAAREGCDHQGFARLVSLIMHVKRKHGRNFSLKALWPYLTCRICSRQHDSKKQLESHFKTRHPGKRPYACHRCENSYLNYRNLKNHGSICAADFPCAYCSQTRTRVSVSMGVEDYKAHVSTRHPEWARDVNIDELFGRNEKAVVAVDDSDEEETEHEECSHRMTLTKPLPKCCGTCDTEFPTVLGYETHCANFHPTEKMFNCRYDGCNCRFTRVSSLCNHERRQHARKKKFNVKKKNYSTEKFKCHECRKIFHSKDTIEAHFEINHKGKSMRMCHFCSIAFDSPKSASRHNLIVHGSSKFEGRRCQETPTRWRVSEDRGRKCSRDPRQRMWKREKSAAKDARVCRPCDTACGGDERKRWWDDVRRPKRSTKYPVCGLISKSMDSGMEGMEEHARSHHPERDFHSKDIPEKADSRERVRNNAVVTRGRKIKVEEEADEGGVNVKVEEGSNADVYEWDSEAFIKEEYSEEGTEDREETKLFFAEI